MQKKLFYGWKIVMGCFLIMCITIGLGISSFAVFFKPVTDALGFSRGEFSLSITMISVFAMLTAPIFGKLIKKTDIRVLMTLSSIIFALSFGLYSQCRTVTQFYICAAFEGIGLAGTYVIPVAVLITNWFQEKRSFAMGLAMTGSGVGGMVFSLLNNWAIISFGWEKAFMVLGGVIAIILIPISLFVVRLRPSDLGLTPYGVSKEKGITLESENNSLTFSEAIRTSSFWLLGASFFIAGILAMGVQMHYPAYLEDIGFTSTFAALILSITSGVLILGKLFFGVICDRFGSKNSVVYIYLLFALALILLTGAKNLWVVFAFSIIFGFASPLGTIPISIWTAEAFGKKDYAVMLSTMNIFLQIGVGLGSPLTGYICDIKGSYMLAWSAYIVLAIIGMAFGFGAFFKSKLVTKEYAGNSDVACNVKM